MNIFELLSEKFVLPAKPKLFESFAGIGCQRMALNRLEIPYEAVGISEIDKYAIASYMAIHGDTKNYGDICKINGHDLPAIDIFTYSFPCTDLSKAGTGKGMGTHKERTRSGLVYEVLRILHELQDLNNLPKVLIMENVVDLVQAKFIRQFQEIQLELEQMGYSNFAQVINGKDMGVAQNRERIFMVSILGDYYYEFPQPMKLEKRLKDYLEPKVAEKYYLSEKLLNCFVENSKKMEENGNGFRFRPKDDEDIANGITTKTSDRMEGNFYAEPLRLGGVFDKDDGNHQAGSIWDTKGVSPTIDTMQGGHRQPCIIDDSTIYDGYNGVVRADQDTIGAITTNIGHGDLRNAFTIIEPTICASRGRPDGDRWIQEVEIGEPGLSNTLTSVQKDNLLAEPVLIGGMQKNQSVKEDGIATCLTSSMGTGGGYVPMVIEPKIMVIGNIESSHEQSGRIHGTDGISPTVMSNSHGKTDGGYTPVKILEPTIRIPEATEKGYAEAKAGDGVYLNRPHQKRGCVQDGMIQTLKTTSGQDIGVVVKEKSPKQILCEKMLESGQLSEGDMIRHSYTSDRMEDDDEVRVENQDGLSATMTTRADTLGIVVNNNGLRIRKLTPLECWRLMGIDDADFRKAEQVCSNSQLYKQAGNGIIVDVFYHILKQML